MTPKELILQWVGAFNRGDFETLASFYSKDAINHQIANHEIKGRDAIKQMFRKEFEAYEMTCIIENIFEDDEWGILEWKDPLGVRGCGFFHIVNDKIQFQRGYWDKFSFLNAQDAPKTSD